MEEAMLSTHFSLEELLHSDLATANGLDNTPSHLVLDNLRRLAQVLERVRHEVLHDQPLRILSGYRGPVLNKTVGGSRNSAHLKGLAADFICTGFGSPKQICAAIALSTIEFDQLIVEFGRWVHLGLAPEGIAARRQVLSINKQGS
ncbi:Phage protein [Pseudomonas chlororaphis]|uniref:Phage protein n=1 Tax=Pseudomonas chlororaphis TaxID=587753 RepID=A0A3G7TPM9_9PSED|nr:D-Ala-D-Ala carboxypeptidase family metallohydrolase [Pseudomonas chlororaphis]AZE48342.1 Phage protein [Pseudomonas chlororaphis]